LLGAETVVTFLIASCLIGIAPGSDNLFVLTQSIVHGRKAGVWVTLGLCTGLFVHTTAVVLGVAAIVQASAIAFSVLKFAGATYLVYLAWKAFTSAPQALTESDGGNAMDALRLYRRGIIMNITNPKVSMFFLAFLPQFVDPTKGSPAMQTFSLGGLFMLMTLVVFGGVAAMAGQLGRVLKRSPRAQVIMNRLAGVVFLGLAVKIATSGVK
jgi:threonine/homoserine/homoserine lactone efflux protein